MRRLLYLFLCLLLLVNPAYAQWIQPGVTQIKAGTNVTISPSIGEGVVTINASGGGGGGSQFTVSSINSNTNAVANYLYVVNTSGGAVSLTLPDATQSGNEGTPIGALLQTAGHNLTVTTTGGQTINGASSVVTGLVNSFYIFYADGSNWDMVPILPVGSATSNQFVTYLDAAGVQHTAQPAFSNLSGSATAAQMLALASGDVYVGNSSNQPAAVALAGDVSSTSNTGSVTLVQPLHALNGYNTNGLLTQTAQNTFTGRTITGTASDIAVTNGNGVSGNPTLDLVTTAVTPGTYTNTTLTVDSFGRLTNASSGSGTSGNLLTVNTAITGNTNLAINTLYPCNTSGGGLTVTLPDATLTANKGGVIAVWLQTAGNAVTLASTSSQTINGIAPASFNTLTTAGSYWLFYSNGTNWICNPSPAITSATSNQFVTYTDPTGKQNTAQPAFSNLSGAATAAQMLALASGTIYVGNGSNQPASTTPTGGTGLSVTMGAGSMALANTGVTSNVAGTGITVSGATGAVTINAALTVNGVITSNTNAAVGTLYPCNTSGGSFSVTLPDATVAANKGGVICVYLKTAGNALTMASTSSQKINNITATSVTTSTQYTTWWFYCNGVDWDMLPLVPYTGRTSGQYVTYIDAQGVQNTAQPAFSDLSGSATAAQMLALTSGDFYVGNGSNQPAAVAMSGDATLANTGAVTLATVNSSPSTYTNATITVNGKGLVTSASSGSSSGGFTASNKSSSFSAVAGNAYFVTATATCTLPTAASIGGQQILVVNNGSGTITFDTTSSQTINGQASGAISDAVQYDQYLLTSDGANWYF